MRWLITGGAGFIGSHMADRLARDGQDVTILDDLSTGRKENLSVPVTESQFMGWLPSHGVARLMIGNVCSAPTVERLAQGADYVIHLAADLGVRKILEEPRSSMIRNLAGAKAVIDACSMFKNRLVIASTSEVYGNSEAIPFTEDAPLSIGPPSKIRWSYAASKLADEFLAMAAHQERRLHVTVARLFNTVGPRQIGRYGMVVPNLVRQALAGEPLDVYGDGLQTRCFAHVADVVDGLIGLARTGATVGQVYNLGNDQEISILDLARQIIARTKSSSVVRLVPYERAYGPGFEDMRRRVPGLAKIKAAIGYQPTRDLKQIIDDVAASLRSVDHPASAERALPTDAVSV